MSPIAPTDWDRVVDAITSARSLLLLGHVSPDGDALGSALGVGLALATLPGDRRIEVSFGDDPFVIPANLAWLPGKHLLTRATEVSDDPDVVLTFDASSIDRLGLLRELAEKAPLLVAVDHHRSYDGFGQISLVDVDAPATAVVARELIRRLGIDLDSEIAACLYTGLITDTGSFRYSGTTAQTHALAGELLETGIAFDAIAREVFDAVPFGYLGVLGTALGRCQLEQGAAGGYGWVWTAVLAADRAINQLPFDLVEPIIDVVRKASEAEVAMVVKEDDLGDLRVSLRSKGVVDVSAVAIGLGGGGHRYAAGFTATSRDLSEVVDTVRRALDAAIIDPGIDG
ncbi:MAG: bifunctional oligoribonuclease/PAP phosphatase NrnA [Actinomycetia bacterium]|nr:bifunctional oligoribonuclease/PAP phosphatase NrnA [Actinomycetes bacterium]